jgi:S-adenosylmethionine:tRNA ribosyltransferase-isomerase
MQLTDCHPDLLLSSYQYELPPESIAQDPVKPRDHSRLLVVPNETTSENAHFFDLPKYLNPGDLLVFNNSKVIPARLLGEKVNTGTKIEILLISEKSPNCWLTLVKPGRRLPVGTKVKITAHREPKINPDIIAKIVDLDAATGGRIIEFITPKDRPLLAILDNYGKLPLPPYIDRSKSTPEQYQTVYAAEAGSVAAPTAGLHFTPELLVELTAMGVKFANVTLHVGIGTFRPVQVEDITAHQIHQEWLSVPETTVTVVRKTKAAGGRIIAVGTTAIRSLETASQNSEISPYTGQTELFIYPGYKWQTVDGIITNFHLPGSSLLMLVSAWIGRDRLMALYRQAIVDRYRFFSFGDAMLLL